MLSAQHLSFSWMKSIGGSGWDKATGLAFQDETLYIGGNFCDTVQTGNRTLAAYDSNRDIFFSASDKEGNTLWEKQIKGSGYDNLNVLSVKNNRLFLAGEFSDSIFFEDNTFVSSAYINNYLACYKTDGSYKWSTHIRAESRGKPVILKEFEKGHILYGLTVFGKYLINEDSLQTRGKSDIVILKFNPAGKIIDYTVPNIHGEEELIGFEQTKNGFIIAGNFSKAISLGDTTLNAMGENDVFVAKFEQDDLIWIHHIRGFHKTKAVKLVKDKNEQFILGGEFEQAILTGQNDTLIAPGKQAVFFVQYNEDGEEIHAQSLGSTYKSSLQDLYISNTNEIMLTGSFFGTKNYGETRSVSSDTASIDLFIAKYDTSRNIKYVSRLGGSQEDHNGKLIQDSENYFYLSGSFSEDFFAGKQAEDTLLTGKNKRDLFYARFFDCDYGQKLNLPADTSYCGLAEYAAPDSFASYLWNTGHAENAIQTDSSQLYSLEVIDMHGCRSEDSVFIRVHPQPVVNLGPDTLLFADQGIQLDAGEHDFCLWSNGQTGRYLELEAGMLPLGTQNYSVSVLDDSICTAQDDIQIQIIAATNDENKNSYSDTDNTHAAYTNTDKQIQTEPEEKEELLPENDLNRLSATVYPNPNKGNFNILLSNIDIKNKVILEIYSASGKLIKQHQFQLSNNIEIIETQLKNQTSGNYTINIINGNYFLSKKLIINK